MAAEFDRPDIDKSGAIDPKCLQLDRTSFRFTRASDFGK